MDYFKAKDVLKSVNQDWLNLLTLIFPDGTCRWICICTELLACMAEQAQALSLPRSVADLLNLVCASFQAILCNTRRALQRTENKTHSGGMSRGGSALQQMALLWSKWTVRSFTLSTHEEKHVDMQTGQLTDYFWCVNNKVQPRITRK